MSRQNGTIGVKIVKKVKPDLDAIKRLLKIGDSKKTNVRLLVFFIVTIVATLISPVLSYLSKVIIDMLSETYLLGNRQLFGTIAVVVVLLLIFTLLSLIFNNIKDMEQIYINHDTTKKINSYIYNKLNKIKYEYYEDPTTYDVITRVSSNCPGIYSILNSFISLVMAVISTVSYGVLLGSVRWYFIFLVLIPSILYVLAETKNMFERYFLDIQQTTDQRKLNYMHSLFRDKRSNKEIRAFHLLDTLIEKYENLRLKLYKQGMRLLLKQSIVSFSLLVLSKIGIFICLFIVCVACTNGTASIGDISLVLSAGVAFGSSFSSIFSQVNSVTEKAIYLNDWTIFETMDCEEDDSEGLQMVESIEFHNVSYKYPDSEKYVLRNVNCKIQKGTTVALVGENGSGKTTFSKLMLGALTPNEGSITVSNRALQNVLHAFREKVSYVPQNYGTFKMTLENNLRLGKSDIDLNTYKPKFINFYDKLPEGYATPLGNVYKKGVDLSGGEWQRISIERAIIRDGSDVYIMDEPAASLDPLMESELYEHFADELKGKTIIITSHRLGACSLADCIYVFDHGEIIEAGSHEELMRLHGKYYEMYTVQRGLYERSII